MSSKCVCHLHDDCLWCQLEKIKQLNTQLIDGIHQAKQQLEKKFPGYKTIMAWQTLEALQKSNTHELIRKIIRS